MIISGTFIQWGIKPIRLICKWTLHFSHYRAETDQRLQRTIDSSSLSTFTVRHKEQVANTFLSILSVWIASNWIWSNFAASIDHKGASLTNTDGYVVNIEQQRYFLVLFFFQVYLRHCKAEKTDNEFIGEIKDRACSWNFPVYPKLNPCFCLEQWTTMCCSP